MATLIIDYKEVFESSQLTNHRILNLLLDEVKLIFLATRKMMEQLELFNTMYGSTKSLIKFFGDNCDYLKSFSNYDTYSVNRVLSVLRNTQKKI